MSRWSSWIALAASLMSWLLSWTGSCLTQGVMATRRVVYLHEACRGTSVSRHSRELRATPGEIVYRGCTARVKALVPTWWWLRTRCIPVPMARDMYDMGLGNISANAPSMRRCSPGCCLLMGSSPASPTKRQPLSGREVEESPECV